MFFSNTRWTELLAPLEILMSKISLKYIPIHIHNFEHSRVVINMKLSSHGKLQHILLSDATGTSNVTDFYGQMKQKMSFLAANTQDGFAEHRDKKYPLCTMKYTLVFFMLWAYFLLEILDILFRHTASRILSNTNR